MITNQLTIPITSLYLWNYGNLSQLLPNLHNHLCIVNTAQQDNTGCIPKALWDQLLPHVKSTISNSQHHAKHQVNRTTAHFKNHTDHSVTNTLPMYSSNFVHHMPSEIAPTSSTKILNSIMSS